MNYIYLRICFVKINEQSFTEMILYIAETEECSAEGKEKRQREGVQLLKLTHQKK